MTCERQGSLSPQWPACARGGLRGRRGLMAQGCVVQEGLGVTVHAGEVPNAAEVDAVLAFRPDRIGHFCCASDAQQQALLVRPHPATCAHYAAPCSLAWCALHRLCWRGCRTWRQHDLSACGCDGSSGLVVPHRGCLASLSSVERRHNVSLGTSA